MYLTVSADATFVRGWQRPGDYNRLLKTPVTETKRTVLTGGRGELATQPDAAYYAAVFPELDTLIQTPLAFAILAPKGWPGECCWFEYDMLPKFGWQAIAWKESTHLDKSLVQLYMRELPRALPAERPKEKPNESTGYSSIPAPGCLPYMGCSSILASFDTPKHKFGLDQIKLGMYGKVEPEKCLALVRLARPVALASVATLREAGFWRCAQTLWNQYWVRGKPGLGRLVDCVY